MEFYFIGPIVFSALWFTNLVQLLENLKKDRDIHNQKILGCLWSAALTISIIFAIGKIGMFI